MKDWVRLLSGCPELPVLPSTFLATFCTILNSTSLGSKDSNEPMLFFSTYSDVCYAAAAPFLYLKSKYRFVISFWSVCFEYRPSKQ